MQVSQEIQNLEEEACLINWAELSNEQTDEIFRSRVAAGIALLNEKEWSEPWYNVINLDKLDISDPQDCVVGQLFPAGYSVGLNMLGLGLGLAHGFSGWNQTRLTRIWKEEILKLRENHVQ